MSLRPRNIPQGRKLTIHMIYDHKPMKINFSTLAHSIDGNMTWLYGDCVGTEQQLCGVEYNWVCFILYF